MAEAALQLAVMFEIKRCWSSGFANVCANLNFMSQCGYLGPVDETQPAGTKCFSCQIFLTLGIGFIRVEVRPLESH